MMESYDLLLKTINEKHWKRIGPIRRAGVATPLFSIYSKKSIGIGEIQDLEFLVDWCKKCGMSIIQLLPLNDVGFDFRPYDAQSTLALDPMYLSLGSLSDCDLVPFKKDISALKRKFPIRQSNVDYRIKAAKLELLWRVFESIWDGLPSGFQKFCETNRLWLRSFALFKTIQIYQEQRSWEQWPDHLKLKNQEAIEIFQSQHEKEIRFQEWLQWQLFEQFRGVKEYARQNGVFFMGDLPFLVSRNSADVWGNQHYFKLDLISGAPPDPYFANGQRWGMPPYNWSEIEKNGYDYLKQKLSYASHFYDLYRIDHVVGVFRLWTIARAEPLESGGLKGKFDPEDEAGWEEHGRRLLSVMIENADMLPCAEDLGTVPPCSYKVLNEFGIPGMDVQRWCRAWKTTKAFTPPEKYRTTSISVVSTHDMSALAGWWLYEAGTVDAILFERKCAEIGLDFGRIKEILFDATASAHGRLRWKSDIKTVEQLLSMIGRDRSNAWAIAGMYEETYDEREKFWNFLGLEGDPEFEVSESFVKETLKRVSETSSVFSVQLLQDWLLLSDLTMNDVWNFRINFPGTLTDSNWTLQLPFSLEEMMKLPGNKLIKTINHDTNRI